jgi:pyruvate carboxylase
MTQDKDDDDVDDNDERTLQQALESRFVFVFRVGVLRLSVWALAQTKMTTTSTTTMKGHYSRLGTRVRSSDIEGVEGVGAGIQ